MRRNDGRQILPGFRQNRWRFDTGELKPDYRVDPGTAIDAMGWEGEPAKLPLECYVIVTIPRGMLA